MHACRNNGGQTGTNAGEILPCGLAWAWPHRIWGCWLTSCGRLRGPSQFRSESPVPFIRSSRRNLNPEGLAAPGAPDESSTVIRTAAARDVACYFLNVLLLIRRSAAVAALGTASRKFRVL